MSIWLIWIIAGVILFILEIFTPGFLLACFGVGCMATGVSTYLGAGLKIQILSFALSTMIVFFGVRPFVLKYLFREKDIKRTNVDALIGASGFVISTIDPSSRTGRVNIKGEDWKGVSVSEEIIEKDTKVIVRKVEGTKVIVERLND